MRRRKRERKRGLRMSIIENVMMMMIKKIRMMMIRKMTRIQGLEKYYDDHTDIYSNQVR